MTLTNKIRSRIAYLTTQGNTRECELLEECLKSIRDDQSRLRRIAEMLIPHTKGCDNVLETVAAAASRIAELEKDRVRLTWLESEGRGCDLDIKFWQLVRRRNWANLRDAIDNAMEQSK